MRLFPSIGFSSDPGRPDAGFTLTEVLVVVAITVLISGALVSNFSRIRTDLNREVSAIQGQIRGVQARTVSGVAYKGATRCGYGIHYDTAGQYIVYAGPDASLVECSTYRDKNYSGPPQEEIVETRPFLNPRLMFKQIFLDVFFEPPDPKTYINNDDFLVATGATAIVIGLDTADCTASPKDCRAICIYPSGKIESRPYAPPPATCP